MQQQPRRRTPLAIADGDAGAEKRECKKARRAFEKAGDAVQNATAALVAHPSGVVLEAAKKEVAASLHREYVGGTLGLKLKSAIDAELYKRVSTEEKAEVVVQHFHDNGLVSRSVAKTRT